MSILSLFFFAVTSASLLTGCEEPPGVTLLLEARSSDAVSNEEMERTRAIVGRRMEGIGGSDAHVERRGANRLLVTLRQSADVEMARSLIGRRGRLEFKAVLREQPSQDELATRRAPTGLQYLPSREGGFLAVERRPVIRGEHIVRAEQRFNEQGEPDVSITFDAVGSRQFERYTRDHVAERFAIVLDGVILSAPMIREPILGGVASIAGGFTLEEAEELAIQLRSGTLPVDLVIIEEHAPER